MIDLLEIAVKRDEVTRHHGLGSSFIKVGRASRVWRLATKATDSEKDGVRQFDVIFKTEELDRRG